MNDALSRVTVQGMVLDLGAGAHGSSSYHTLIRGLGASNFVSVDIERRREPNIVANFEASLPVRSCKADAVLAINLLEHLYNPIALLTEIHRVLRPGGTLHIVVPFLVSVHPDPKDFFRYAPDAIYAMLEEAGFRQDVEVVALATGPFGAAYSQIGPMIPRALQWLVGYTAIMLDKLVGYVVKKRQSALRLEYFPLAYYVRAVKAREDER